ncbi:hypothetical protein DEO72_LG5g1459 [Vigna unguiculata]|uniref:Uncharacterized protein n=1 Tax=Vigna unguiculata TaxID=3917 RepID=A0A4D6LZY2_VIGUN|nr:hypothetical protein DEO72_LG5g1459 [Vigna unguiculata]
MEVLEQLPKKIPTRKIVHCYLSPKSANDISGYMAQYVVKVGADENVFIKLRRHMFEAA